MTIDIERFCARLPSKVATVLQSPFSIGPFTYASNGPIAIRVPRRADVPETFEALIIERAFDYPDDLPFLPLPDIAIPEITLRPCGVCRGIGTGVLCSQCDGTGDCDCGCGDNHECGICKGSGILPSRRRGDSSDEPREWCLGCDGRGTEDDTRIVGFADIGLRLRATYLAEVLRLPGPITIGVKPMELDRWSGSMEHCAPVLFHFDGGMAVVMPMRARAVDADIVVQLPAEPAEAP